MRFPLLYLLLVMSVGGAGPAAAQGETGAAPLPSHYVPLPPGMETEPLETFLADAPAPAPVLAAPAPAPDRTPAPPAADPLTQCREQVGYDSDRALGRCLEESYGASLRFLEQAAKTAHAAAARRGQESVRLLAGTNMAFVAFRDAECTRQKNGAPDAQAAARAEWACHAGLNNMRAHMLGAP